jgi:hypothetical protein
MAPVIFFSFASRTGVSWIGFALISKERRDGSKVFTDQGNGKIIPNEKKNDMLESKRVNDSDSGNRSVYCLTDRVFVQD